MASKRALRRSACEGKQRFTYYRAAYVAMQMRRRQHGEVIDQYKCQFCSGWHVGHPSMKTIRRRRVLAEIA